MAMVKILKYQYWRIPYVHETTFFLALKLSKWRSGKLLEERGTSLDGFDVTPDLGNCIHILILNVRTDSSIYKSCTFYTSINILDSTLPYPRALPIPSSWRGMPGWGPGPRRECGQSSAEGWRRSRPGGGAPSTRGPSPRRIPPWSCAWQACCRALPWKYILRIFKRTEMNLQLPDTTRSVGLLTPARCCWRTAPGLEGRKRSRGSEGEEWRRPWNSRPQAERR